jgi:hypothetical protein
MTFRNVCLAGLLLLGTAATGSAGTLALDILSNTSNDVFVGDVSVGWKFTISGPLLVTALDFYDSTAHPDTQSHDIAIFDASQNIVVSATVTTANALVGNAPWLSQSVTPTTLGAGTYYIAGYTTGDVYTTTPLSYTIVPGVTYVTDAYNFGTAGLTFPSQSSGYPTGGAYFGASFEVQIPEPATWGFALLGLTAIVLRKRLY